MTVYCSDFANCSRHTIANGVENITTIYAGAADFTSLQTYAHD